MHDWKLHIRRRLEAAGHETDSDIVEELAQHAANEWAAARAEGLEPADAEGRVRELLDEWAADGSRLTRRAANRAAAPEPPPAEAAPLSGVLQDARYAIRIAVRRPGAALIAVLTMALGIGAVTTLFSVAWGVLLKPLPLAEPETLIRLEERLEGADRSFPWILTNRTAIAWREAPATIESLGLYTTRTATLTGVGAYERVRVTSASASLFTVLRTVPAAGSLFTADDEESGRTALVSHGFWQRQFGGAPTLLGRSIQLDGRDYTVAGVLPAGFAFPERDVAVWVPLAVQPPATPDGGFSVQMFGAIARLRSGATPRQAADEATARANSIPPNLALTALFGSRTGRATVRAETLLDATTADVRDAIWVLLAAVALLLATATANIASVQLARATSRRREFAIRASIGAGGSRLARQLLVESLVIGLAGGIAGLGLAAALHRTLPALLPPGFPRLDDIAFDWRAAAFSGVLAVVTSLAFGLMPALQARRLDLRAGLAGDPSAGGASLGRSRDARVRGLIMAGQVAVACVLLVGASLLVRTFIQMVAVDRGYDPSNLLTARLTTPGGLVPAERRAALAARALERLRAHPDVEHAGVTNILPLVGGESVMASTVRAMPGQPEQVIHMATRVVSTGYFEAMRMRLREGRLFDARDTRTSMPSLVVNRAFADKYFSEGAVGRRIPAELQDGMPDWEVIGVVDNALMRDSPGDIPGPEVFFSTAQLPPSTSGQSGIIFVVRTRGNPMPLAAVLRQVVSSEEPAALLESVMTMEDRLDGSLARPRLYGVVLAGVAGFALLIAAVGLFGVLSYAVAQRSRELAMRAALGATPWQVVTLVVREGLTIGAAGTIAGVTVSLFATRWLSSFLFGVAPRDVVTFALVPAVLLVVAVVASAVPARRAARLDVLEVLRA